MAEKVQNYTVAGFEKLKKELEHLENVEMPQIQKDIATARSFGDLSENSEYDEAKNREAQTAYRITELKELIKNANVISDEDVDVSTVSLGSIVKIYNEKKQVEVTYHIVGSNEADAFKHQISDLSPIGSALLNAHVGDIVVAETPNGEVKLHVLEISRA